MFFAVMLYCKLVVWFCKKNVRSHFFVGEGMCSRVDMEVVFIRD